MKRGILFSICGGVALVTASAASAQIAPAAGAPAGADTRGGPRPQDIAAANRQVDDDYNTLAARGVKVTNKSRDLTGLGATRTHAKVGPATAADVKPGAQVRDIKGVPIGTVAILDANEVVTDPSQVVVDTGQTKIGVPLTAFGKDDKGLLLSVTAEKFNQLVAQAHASTSTNTAKSN